MIYGGDGLARMPAAPGEHGKAVFVPFVLPGERVAATVVEEKPGFARAQLDSVMDPSGERVKPGCPYFGECGGCQYQHAGYERQLEIKREILRETFVRTAKVELPEGQAHASPPWNYRNRTRLKIRTKPFAIGYYRFRSHMLLPVRECPISSPLINRAIAAMWKLGESAAGVAEIEFFADAADEKLLVELSLGERQRANWESLGAFASAVRGELPEIVGIAVLRPERPGIWVREKAPASFGEAHLSYTGDGAVYRVSGGSFFQTNRFLTSTLLSLVTSGRSGTSALDLYAGTGLFSLPLSQSYREVTAVEIAPYSFEDLKSNVPSNVKAVRATTEKYLAEMGRGARFDYVVVDPPRGGLGEKTALALAGLGAPEITYVSCDPATLARDVRVLRSAGYELAAAHLVDLFPQTFHIETVLSLKR